MDSLLVQFENDFYISRNAKKIRIIYKTNDLIEIFLDQEIITVNMKYVQYISHIIGINED